MVQFVRVRISEKSEVCLNLSGSISITNEALSAAALLGEEEDEYDILGEDSMDEGESSSADEDVMNEEDQSSGDEQQGADMGKGTSSRVHEGGDGKHDSEGDSSDDDDGDSDDDYEPSEG